MIRHKYIIGVYRKLLEIHEEMDSAAAIEGSKMNPTERAYMKSKLKEILNYLDQQLNLK